MSEEKVSLRELLRVEFASVRAELKASSDISKIAYKSLEKEIHTTQSLQRKTNGRVLKLEEDMRNVKDVQASCPINYVKDKDIEQDGKINELTTQTEVVRFFANRPKMFKIIFSVMVLTTLFSLFISFIAISEKIIPFIVNLIK